MAEIVISSVHTLFAAEKCSVHVITSGDCEITFKGLGSQSPFSFAAQSLDSCSLLYTTVEERKSHSARRNYILLRSIILPLFPSGVTRLGRSVSLMLISTVTPTIMYM